MAGLVQTLAIVSLKSFNLQPMLYMMHCANKFCKD